MLRSRFLSFLLALRVALAIIYVISRRIMKRVYLVFLIVSLTIAVDNCHTVFEKADFSSFQKMVRDNESWVLEEDKGLLETEVIKSPLEFFTGFAFRIEGDMSIDEALTGYIFWSYDGKSWDGPIFDDEISVTNPDEQPFSNYIFSDFYYPDDPPALYYKVILEIEDKDAARLGQFEMIFINCGRTEEPLEPVMRVSETAELCPMPSYIDRYGWGCGEAGSPSWWPSYTNAWIWAIHHTAGATSTPSDPAATMRSIWSYHTYTNGWGDIGYQFVLDHLGNIYQGRYNADLANLDAVGAHVGGHNTGCVGLSVMGNFETHTLHTATLEALYDLVSWKCEQRDIDPHGSSWLVDGTYPNISGHRDIGSTACPGANFYPLLPSIRDTVANRLAGSPEPPAPGGDTTIVDNGDAGYTTTGSWVNGTYSTSSGYLDDYQFCNVGGDRDRAIFTPNLPEDGTYDVYMWWYGGGNRCNDVSVRIQGLSTDFVTVSQRDAGSSWHHLGGFDFEAGISGNVSISDSTYSGDGCYVVIADAVMWSLRYPLASVENRPENLGIRFYPNPFNSACTIEGPEGAYYSIFDLKGRTVEYGQLDGGMTIWQPEENIPSGNYFIRIEHQKTVMVGKLKFVK